MIDLALKYRYDSPDVFSRDYKSLYGVTPTKARSEGIELKSILMLSFQMTIKGDVEMNYGIEVLDFEVEIVGVKQKVLTKDAFNIIPKLWEDANKTGLLQKLIDMSWENPQCKMEGILGVCGKQAAITDEEFDYFMGCRYTNDFSNDMEKIVIP